MATSRRYYRPPPSRSSPWRSISSSTGSCIDRVVSRMSTRAAAAAPREKGATLLEIKNLRIEGFSDDKWHQIVRGIDIALKRGDVLGLIGESGAGKSTIGLAAMGYAKPGCRISGGSVVFDGIDLLAAGDSRCRELRGSRIAYV